VKWDSICVSEVPTFCSGESCTGGGSSSGGSSGGSSSSSGGGGGGCAHAVCKAGAPLAPTCSTCAGDVCSQDPYCCSVAWDKICVSEVAQFCSGQSCP
jgi:hypothetical protein